MSDLVERLRSRARQRIENADLSTFCAPLHGQVEWQAADRIEELEAENEALRETKGGLQSFCIWLTGCGYDFCQHDYFIKQRDTLLKDYEVGAFEEAELPKEPEE